MSPNQIKSNQIKSNQIEIVQADISNVEDRLKIFNVLPKDAKISCLIHNAVVIEATELKDITLESWRNQIAVNVEGPLFLTQLLLPFFKKWRTCITYVIKASS